MVMQTGNLVKSPDRPLGYWEGGWGRVLHNTLSTKCAHFEARRIGPQPACGAVICRTSVLTVGILLTSQMFPHICSPARGHVVSACLCVCALR